MKLERYLYGMVVSKKVSFPGLTSIEPVPANSACQVIARGC